MSGCAFCGQGLRDPLARWLGDDQPSADTEKGRCTLSDNGWAAERAGHHPLEVGSIERIAPADLGPLVDDADPPLQSACADGLVEELGPSLVGLEEHQGYRRPVGGDHQTGQSTPRSQVDQAGYPGPHFSPDQVGEPLGVLQVPFDWSRAEKTGLSGRLEHPKESRTVRSLLVGGRQPTPGCQPAGAMTM